MNKSYVKSVFPNHTENLKVNQFEFTDWLSYRQESKLVYGYIIQTISVKTNKGFTDPNPIFNRINLVQTKPIYIDK